MRGAASGNSKSPCVVPEVFFFEFLTYGRIGVGNVGGGGRS